MSLKDNICAACVQNERKHTSNDFFLFNDVNCLNSESVSTHLSAFSEIEEMLITCVHVHQQIAHVHNHQY